MGIGIGILGVDRWRDRLRCINENAPPIVVWLMATANLPGFCAILHWRRRAILLTSNIEVSVAISSTTCFNVSNAIGVLEYSGLDLHHWRTTLDDRLVGRGIYQLTLKIKVGIRVPVARRHLRACHNQPSQGLPHINCSPSLLVSTPVIARGKSNCAALAS